jgi:hypothetical protein
MDLRPYIEDLERMFLLAAESRGKETLAIAEELLAPLDASIRLVLLHALSAAADEITCDLAPGSVDVRLRGLDPAFVVTVPPQDVSQEDIIGGDAWDVADNAGDDGEVTARINFRPPEQVKSRIEEAAHREGLSVNAWLVRAVGAVLEGGQRRSGRREPKANGQHYIGWVR